MDNNLIKFIFIYLKHVSNILFINLLFLLLIVFTYYMLTR